MRICEEMLVKGPSETETLVTHEESVTHLTEVDCPTRVEIDFRINFYMEV